VTSGFDSECRRFYASQPPLEVPPPHSASPDEEALEMGRSALSVTRRGGKPGDGGWCSAAGRRPSPNCDHRSRRR
jgi:hypothetical protein